MVNKGTQQIDLIVRFTGFRPDPNFTMSFRSNMDVDSLFLHQIKSGLMARGKGLSQFNILSRDDLNILRSLAASCELSAELYPDLLGFSKLFGDLFAGSTSIALKIYVVRCDKIYTATWSFGHDSSVSTIKDILEFFDLPSTCPSLSLGCSLSNETTLRFLQENCCYGDGFVHLVVKLN
jgi:hypothetical protein